MSEIRIFLVDDHLVVCEGLRRMLEQEDMLSVVGDAESGEEALERLGDAEADVVLLDARLTGMDGIETLRKLKQTHPQLKVIMTGGWRAVCRRFWGHRWWPTVAVASEMAG